jgi:hypothetical protein
MDEQLKRLLDRAEEAILESRRLAHQNRSRVSESRFWLQRLLWTLSEIQPRKPALPRSAHLVEADVPPASSRTDTHALYVCFGPLVNTGRFRIVSQALAGRTLRRGARRWDYC